MSFVLRTLLFLALSSNSFAYNMVIILDDIGNVKHSGERAIRLPGQINFAIMPDRPFSSTLAKLAADNDKDVIIHMPMSNHSNFNLGPLGLQNPDDSAEIEKNLAAAFISVPNAIGLNNHMGSKFTESNAGMATVINYLKQHDKFFIDSVTTPYSVAKTEAAKAGIVFDSRDVFLDHEQTRDFIDRQFKLALKIVERRGSVIIIGHPYPQTLDYLEEVLPLLPELGIKTVKLSEYLALSERQLTATAKSLMTAQPTATQATTKNQ